MTIQEAIKYVKEVTGMSLPWGDNHYEALQMAIAALEQKRWIPVSERLPEDFVPVLVATQQKDRLPKWVEKQTYSYVTDIDTHDNKDGWHSHKKAVVAWMPLPEPYKS